MKHNFPNSYINFIYKKKFGFPHFMYMKCVLAVLCCIMIIPCMTYAQAVENEAGTLEIEEEQYILKRTGEILVKIFGSVELDWDSSTRVLLTHVTPEGDTLTHNVMTNDEGYYEFYFSHNWKSIRGDYEVFTSINAIPIGNVSYELVQDPSYKTDQEVKEEYLLKDNTKNDFTTSDYKTGLMIEADAVEGSTTITITGHATSIVIPVTIMVLAPNGNIVSIDQINIDSDGSFTSIIGVGGPMWKQDGFYSITAQQGSNTLNKSTVEVEIVGGAVIPEFGTVASLILVVAISSIVLLSTKSKLKFQIR